MKQEELENRVREIFREQGFEVSEREKCLLAESGNGSKKIQVFSSEKYSLEEAADRVINGKLVFVDEGLREMESEVENRVSVLEERNEESFETPSYELIGDIAVINELDEMSKDNAVEAIRHYHPQVKTVLLKEEPLSGEFRVGEYEKLFGEETETVHKEFGCKFKVDPTEVYYSERFSTERNRVVSQIEEGERVLVMFAGVGPYAIMAAKNANPEKVVAVEKNPKAVEYMRENVELNGVENRVEVYEGDVRDILPDLDGEFDRIVMPLPGSAEEFLGTAVEAISENGVIHYYSFIEDENWESVVNEIEIALSNQGHEFKVHSRTVCGEKGPGIQRVCLDLNIRQ